MPFIFTRADLLVDISEEELAGVAEELVENGDPDPITNTINEQVQKVEDYTLRYNVPDLRMKRLTRSLVLFELYSRLQAIPDKRQKKYDEAMKELKDIRDGKFPDLAIETPAPEGLPGGQGRWGSNKRIK